jgi:hypothetical protein
VATYKVTWGQNAEEQSQHLYRGDNQRPPNTKFLIVLKHVAGFVEQRSLYGTLVGKSHEKR